METIEKLESEYQQHEVILKNCAGLQLSLYRLIDTSTRRQSEILDVIHNIRMAADKTPIEAV